MKVRGIYPQGSIGIEDALFDHVGWPLLQRKAVEVAGTKAAFSDSVVASLAPWEAHLASLTPGAPYINSGMGWFGPTRVFA